MEQELSILTIGNSFTWSLSDYFQKVVESAGCRLHLEFANHGGCELRRHWEYIENEQRDGAYYLYQDRTKKLREILSGRKWDVVTIQQASHDSWRKETYLPYADYIVSFVRQYAPDAEIVIQQTWSYRADDPRLLPGGKWNLDQTRMYELLTEAYRELAGHIHARIIPTGYAVQLARQGEKKPFQVYDPKTLVQYRWPDLPPQAGDVVGQLYWSKDPETGNLQIGLDSIHLNERGRYLQSCVWFAMLYGRSTEEIRFVPDTISDSDAAELRNCAQQAVKTFPQVK